MAKRVDPLKAKQAKQKKVAIGLCVLLAGVVAFQGPKMLKMMKGPQAAAVAEPAAPAAAPTGTGAVPDPAVAAPATAAPVAPTEEAVLADSDVAPDAESGQLLSIDSFSTKDPFAQQVTELVPSDNPPPAGDSAPPSTPATTPSDSGAPAGTFDPLGSNPQDQDPNAPPVSTTPSAPSVAPPATATETTISINGVTESVAALASFPAADPVFVLESLAQDGKSALISVAGGSYSNGKQTVKLQIGKRLTLQNTSDGSRYDLELLTVAGFVPPKK
jgi:hypothetical protein